MENTRNFEGKHETQKMKSTDQVKLEYEMFEIKRFLDSVEAPIYNPEGDKLSVVDRIKAYKEDNEIRLNWDYMAWFDITKQLSPYSQKDWNQTLVTRINQISAMLNTRTFRHSDTIEVNSKVLEIIKTFGFYDDEVKKIGIKYQVIVNDDILGNDIYVYYDKHDPIQGKITILNY